MDDARRYISALAAECLRFKTGKLLLERQVNVLPGRVLAYYKAATMSDMFPAGMQVAIVESDGEARERLQWGIDHSDADSINVKLFGTAADAERWLLDSGRPSRSRKREGRKPALSKNAFVQQPLRS